MTNISDIDEYDELTEESPTNNFPIEREEKGYGKFIESIFWPLILIIALLIAGAVTWLIATPSFTKPSSPPAEDTATSPTATTSSKIATESSNKNKLKPAEDSPKPAPPPPEVYWSILSRQLSDLEQERVVILNLLGQKSPPPLPEPKSEEPQRQGPEKIATRKQDNDSKTSWPSTPNSVQKDIEISWTTVSQQLLKLEQERERTFSLLADKTSNKM